MELAEVLGKSLPLARKGLNRLVAGEFLELTVPVGVIRRSLSFCRASDHACESGDDEDCAWAAGDLA